MRILAVTLVQVITSPSPTKDFVDNAKQNKNKYVHDLSTILLNTEYKRELKTYGDAQWTHGCTTVLCRMSCLAEISTFSLSTL